ncbi:four-carbon acid sugar kinase family protein [Adhaeribacter rhizoryzae]|uniref:Four-carbon acid sugar kinase family protein n=1 Tax=Adhaeribacter rhizoryzae TaxID=2607907 RepID=A0A5M6D2Q3_9BACT|nr:four-carbon acid sugar kinase family protein [Adhaeribacter rhizoryzae]KAA5540870.1 four-carbon acid sugar kinase family protein [Adhaeribacter rhizoryzae]
MSKQPNNLMLAYYGDDFTGSTDALEFLSRAGARTVLFMNTPTPEHLSRYSGLQAIGVAGKTRAMAPAEMEQELRPAFTALQALGIPHVHYKVCSTFDSSPNVGSIGKAIEVGAEIFQAAFVPLLVAAPALGRHCVFGNLFARMGIGSQGNIYRLDRHPSMSRHPVTPADESDLRLHLARQTTKQIGLFDILQVGRPADEALKILKEIINQGAEVVLFDALYSEQLAAIGSLLDIYANSEKPLFSVGSSGIEMALGQFWTEQNRLPPAPDWPNPGKAKPLLVASGSCSPVTAGQISWALAQGFAEIALDTVTLAHSDRENTAGLLQKYLTEALEYLDEGRSVIIHTSRGADDERIDKTAAVLHQQGLTAQQVQSRTAHLYGTALGNLVRAILEKASVQRVVIAGGDTSSYAARALGIEAVEMIAPLSPGAPLCRAYAPGSPIDGREVNFKGGQVGSEDYFGLAAAGKIYIKIIETF